MLDDAARRRIIEAIAAEQEAMAGILEVLLAKLRKTADLLGGPPDCVPLHDRMRLVGHLEKVIAGEILAISEKERAMRDLLRALLEPSPCARRDGAYGV